MTKETQQEVFNEFWEAGVKSGFRFNALTIHHYPDPTRKGYSFYSVGCLFADALVDLDLTESIEEILINIANELGLEVPSEN